MPGNLWKLSSRNLTVTSTMTIGSSSHVQKYQKALRSYHQYGQCNASKTLRWEESQRTRQGSTFTVGSRNSAQTNMKPTRLWLHGLLSGFSLSLVSYSIWPFAKLTSLCPIHKPPSRWTCTCNFPQVFTPSTRIPRITSSSYLPTSTGKSKPVTCGTVTSSPSYLR